MSASHASSLVEAVRSRTSSAKLPAYYDELHRRMRAKLLGFLDRGDTIARRYPMSDTSLPARYARAIATYRHGDLRAAIAQIDALIQVQPNNPNNAIVINGVARLLVAGTSRRTEAA